MTVLFSRTQPLIRYEMSDQLRLSGDTCSCGRPFALVAEVGGRSEHVVVLPGRDGPVSVHPVLFDAVLETAPVRVWQIVSSPTGIRVRVAGPTADFDPNALGVALAKELVRVGARVDHLPIEVVAETERSPTRKARLVVHEP